MRARVETPPATPFTSDDPGGRVWELVNFVCRACTLDIRGTAASASDRAANEVSTEVPPRTASFGRGTVLL